MRSRKRAETCFRGCTMVTPTAADAEARQASQSSRRVLQSVGRHRAVLRREDPFWADVGDRSLSSRFSDSAVALFHQTYPEFPSGDGSGQ
jgi:hypothetical protein